MSDDLGKKVQQILQLLGQENVPDNLKELVSLLGTSMGTKKSDVGQAASPDANNVEKTANAEPIINTEMLNTARKAMDRLNAGSDPRINLLHAKNRQLHSDAAGIQFWQPVKRA